MNAQQLAEKLGLDRKSRGWRGDCPACQYTGTFSVKPARDGSAIFFCASCQDRNAIAAAVERGTGTAQARRETDAGAKAADDARKRERALALWNGSEPAAATIARNYLSARGLSDLACSAALRFRADCPHPEAGRLPAMVALVTGPDGAAAAIHRTYLRRDGSGKADVEPAKASLGPIWRGAIRLDAVAPELVIGEGIETSASAGRMVGLPAWAAISAGNLERALALPAEVRAVVIAADPDPPGERAARGAALRWMAEGRRVRIARPNVAGQDFNDMLRETARG